SLKGPGRTRRAGREDRDVQLPPDRDRRPGARRLPRARAGRHERQARGARRRGLAAGVARRTAGRPVSHVLPASERLATTMSVVTAASTVLRLDTRPPFDGAGVLRWLAARAVPGVEEIRDDAYRRTLRLP